MLRTGEMPPMERKRPPAADIEAVIQSDRGRARQSRLLARRPNVGRVTVRRLNRAEYNNTIRDLVGVDFQPAADFPSDDVGYGFDNIGDVLSTSPLLFERYLAAAESVLQKAIVVPETVEPKDIRLQGLRVSRGAGEETNGGGVLYRRRRSGQRSRFSTPATTTFRSRSMPSRSATKSQAPRFGSTASRCKNSKSPRRTATSCRFSKPKSAFPPAPLASASPFSIPTSAPDSHRRMPQAPLALRPQHRRRRPVQSAAAARASAHQQQAARSSRRPGTARGGPRDHHAVRRRAFRRPVQARGGRAHPALYDLAEKEGERYEERLRLALCRVLVSPHFLFRVELDPPGAKAGEAYPISEYELASRLSYFLWSTMPDDELFDLAREGRAAQEPARAGSSGCSATRSRPRSSQNFAGQWLTLRKLAYVVARPEALSRLRRRPARGDGSETELFFEAILREDRSILDFLDADFTFVNERLAGTTASPASKGAEFRKVNAARQPRRHPHAGEHPDADLEPDAHLAGEARQVGARAILGTPPPPPPPDVPELDETEAADRHAPPGDGAAPRQRRSAPRATPAWTRSASPSRTTTPIGAWRDKDGEFPIDPSGELPDGQKFQGPAELKDDLEGQEGVVRPLPGREDADLRPGPRPGVLRPMRRR